MKRCTSLHKYLDTKVTTSILGVKITLPIKGVIPLDTIVPIKQDFHVKDTIAVKSNNPILIPVHHTFDIPVNITIKGVIPRNEKSLVGSGAIIEADATIKDKIQVTAEFNPFYELEECPQINPQKQAKTHQR